jgi:uncharacterized protein with HEPN domain
VDRIGALLAQMIEATGLASVYIEGMAFEDFLDDKRTQQAVLMNLIIVGEAASRLMSAEPAFVTLHPDIPWTGMKGMRNRVAHGYFEINLQMVWDTVIDELPKLRAQLIAIQN